MEYKSVQNDLSLNRSIFILLSFFLVVKGLQLSLFSCISHLLLSTTSLSVAPSTTVVFAGLVDAGEFRYFRLDFMGQLVVTLITEKGDADLYLSWRLSQPTFLLDDHDIKSDTCGQDTVEIGRELPRPVWVGVYGHPAVQQASHFRLLISFLEDSDRLAEKDQRAVIATSHLDQLLEVLFSLFSVIVEVLFDLVL